MPAASETVRICHFSDLHLPLQERVPLMRLVGKRGLGYANLRILRGKTHKLAAFEALLKRAASEKADLTIVTGDVANLAVEFEYAFIDRLLRAGGLDPARTLVLPGNHDRYTLGSDLVSAFETGMRDWLPPGFDRRAGYPIVRAVGPVLVLGLDTAVWRNAVRSSGRVDPAQVKRLRAALGGEDARGRWPVIALHHPPFRREGRLLRDYRAGLEGAKLLTGALAGVRATVLHGHLHELSRRAMGGLDIIGVTSASNDRGKAKMQLAYHLYTFDGTGLRSAVAVRHWPDRPAADRFERTDLPDEVPVDTRGVF
ncbi:MAG: metallophosphoesterase [Deltaproteobacteria bacterium]|nr:metallophosphoesterase [Deltaproteobacteria bacterium]